MDISEEDKPPFYHFGWRENNIADYIGCWNMVEGYIDLSEYPKTEDGVYDFSSAIISFEKEEATLNTLEEIADYVAPLFEKARYFYYNKHQFGGVFLLINSEQMEYDSTELIEGKPFGWYDSHRHAVASILIEDQKNLEQYNGNYSTAEAVRDNGERTKEEIDENNFINTASSLFMDAMIYGDCFIKET